MTSLSRLRAAMESHQTPALLVLDSLNLQWLSGFTGSSGAAVVTQDAAVFITDSRYTIQAAEEVRSLEVVSFGAPKNMDSVLAETFARLGLTEVFCETTISYARFQDIIKAHPSVEIKPMPGLFGELRMVKSEEEIEKIRAACRLADQAMEHVMAMLQPGVREYDILLDLEFFLKRQGAAPSFDPIIVGGPNSARPHGKPGERPLEVGDFVTVDLGARLNSYISDITRTFVIREASDRHKEVYGQVLKAQKACCDALVPGAAAADVDALARKILDEKDLSRHFGHGLGHGIGLAVHDFGGLGGRSRDVIAPGQVWTIEPGVYIEGWGGVRIEDDVLVTPDGPELLSFFPKELMVVG